MCHDKFGTGQRKAIPDVTGNQALVTSTVEENPKDEGAAAAKASTNSTLLTTGQYAMFMTASVTVKNPCSDNITSCCLVLDTASHRTFITKALADKLRLEGDGLQSLTISTFGSTKPRTVESTFSDVEIFQKDGSSKWITANILP